MSRVLGVRGVVAAVAVFLTAFGAVGAAARPLRLHVVVRAFGSASAVISNSRYVFAEADDAAEAAEPGYVGTLVDEKTGRRTRVVRPGCANFQAGPIDGPWLTFDCSAGSYGPAPELYSLAGGQWQAVTPNPHLEGFCSTTRCVPSDAGGAWMQYLVSNCPGGEHCSFSYEFQSLNGGELRSDPTADHTIADLNSRSLARPLCAPLRVPRAWYTFTGFGLGSLTMDGKFAIAQGTNANGTPTAYLERCGSSLHELLVKGPYANAAPPLAWNSGEVLWQSATYQLSGVFLPSLRRFKLDLPQHAVSPGCMPPDFRSCIEQMALTNRTLYLLSADGQLWTAISPHQPIATKKRARR